MPWALLVTLLSYLLLFILIFGLAVGRRKSIPGLVSAPGAPGVSA
jgi:hypothetical protein